MFWESISILSFCVLVYIAVNLESTKQRTDVRITISEVEKYEKEKNMRRVKRVNTISKQNS